MPDPLTYEDVKPLRIAITKDVKAAIRKGYVPSSLLRMDIPKGNLTLRPASIPVLEDRLVYTALVGTFADRLDASLEPETVVPSFRVRRGEKDDNLFKFGIGQWFKFQDLIRDAYDDGFRYVLSTDLTAYFEHIDHAVLDDQLADLGVPAKTRGLFRLLLKHWEGRDIGLPQGCEPSSLLGNFYLNPLDKHMKRLGYRYIRYVDDIYIFGHSRSELQKASIQLVHQLRLLGLHVQFAKTKVYRGREILNLVNDRLAEFNAIDYEISAGFTDLAIDDAQKVLKDLLRPGKFNQRHFRKCLNTFKKGPSSIAVRPTLQRLEFLNPWASDIADYLTRFVRSHPSIQRRIIDYLMNPDRNIDHWPERWYANVLREAVSLPRDFLDWMGRRIQLADCNWSVRSEYALLLARHGDLADKQLVRHLIPSRDHDYERRAFIMAMKDYPLPGKKAILDQAERDYPQLKPAVTLARS